MADDLASSLALHCGASLENRLMKAPMTEGLADSGNHATPALRRLYTRWAEGGCRFIVTGNYMVDGRHLERPGNVVIDSAGQGRLAELASSVTERGTHLWVQL